MVFQKRFSVFFIMALFAIPPVFSQESRTFLREFNQLKDTVQSLLKSGEQGKAIEAFYALKDFSEKVLNAPLLNWDRVSAEFYVSQLEDAWIKDIQGFDPMPKEERIFLDEALSESTLPTLIEKEKIFLGFEDIRKEFDKIKMVFHWNVFLPSYLKLNAQGKKDFERFISFDHYHVIRDEKSLELYEVIPRLSDLQALELEVLAQDHSEEGWKKVLKRVAIDLHLSEWLNLNSLWIPSLHPPAERLSLLPLSCQGQYQTLPPLTISHLLAEKEKVASRALFEAQFYTMLNTDEVFQIPVVTSEPFVQKLLDLIPSWRREQEDLLAQDPQEEKIQVQKMLQVMQGLENQFTVYALSWYFQSQNQIPFEWEGTQEELELKLVSQVAATKKILLLAVIERFLWDSKATVDLDIKNQIIALVEEVSQRWSKNEELKVASHRIYELYREAKLTTQEVKQDLLRQVQPKSLVEDQLEDYLELTQKIIAQDQKIAHLKAEQRILFEETIRRGLLLLEAPLLGTEIAYSGATKPLYVHFSEAVQQKKSRDVLVELVQRAVWNKKQILEYEIDRFCSLDPETPQGLEFLLANPIFRKLALLKFPGFGNLNEKVMAQLHEELSEGKFEQAVGYGFLTVIGLSFASGPLRRLPWWLGGRLAKFLPHSLLKGGHVFGTAAAPFAIWWMGEQMERYFWQEEDVIESLENWSEFHIQGRKDSAVTVLDILKEEEERLQASDNGARYHPDILKNKLELRVAQASFLLFSPIQYAFIRGMLSQGYRFYSQSLPFTRRIGISAALKKLYIPTRFLTFKPGNELLALSPQALRQAYLNAIDRSISVKKLTSMVAQWTRLLTRELTEHEAKWGVGATWAETVKLMEAHAKNGWISAQKLIAQRQMLMIRVRFNQEALAGLQNQTISKVSELGLKQRFVSAIEELEGYFDQNLASFYPQDELAWLMMNVDTSQCVGLWFGGWVGIRGSLGHAIDKLAAYQYLSSQRLPLFFSIFR